MEGPLLGHQRVTRDGEAAPSRWLLFCHGVFGMGTNFRGIAKNVIGSLPGWGALLVDLRGHGASQGFAGPHDLGAAASDLDRLSAHLGLEPSGIVGHSFGGKVAMKYLASVRPIDVACILDTQPGNGPMIARDVDRDAAARVLGTLEAMNTAPGSWPSREAFRDALVTQGYPGAIADWLTMNVRRDGKGSGSEDDAFRLRLDLPAIRALLVDYFATDLWSVLEEPGRARALSLVVGGRSKVFDEAALSRARAAATSNAALEVTVLETAGHWVHVDDAAGVIGAIVRAVNRAFPPP